MEIGPRCRVAYNDILFKVLMEFTGAQLPEGRFIKDFQGYIILRGQEPRRRPAGSTWFGCSKNETNMETYVRAARGKLEVDAPNRRVILHLYDGKT